MNTIEVMTHFQNSGIPTKDLGVGVCIEGTYVTVSGSVQGKHILYLAWETFTPGNCLKKTFKHLELANSSDPIFATSCSKKGPVIKIQTNDKKRVFYFSTQSDSLVDQPVSKRRQEQYI